MLGALTTSLSGMISTQAMLDVTANNLSNTETPGFKAGRVSFADQIQSLQRSDTSPGNGLGGVNPSQIGNGTEVSAIQTVFTQGSTELTGRSLDLMINGAGFFQLQDQAGNVTYSRVGAFGFDAGQAGGSPRLVDLATGNLVLNTNGTPIDRVDRIAGTATTALTLDGNLPPTNALPLAGERLSSLFALRQASGDPVTLATPLANTTLRQGTAGAVNLQVFGQKPDGSSYSGTIPLTATSTVGDVVTGLNGILASVNPTTGQSDRFAQVSYANGVLSAEAATSGGQFSLFFGEQAVPAVPPQGAAASTWQYGATTDVYAWNRLRMVPGSVNSELAMYTGDGTQHTVNARWFNSGTVTSGSGASLSIGRTWDLVLDQPADATFAPGGDRLQGLTFNADGSLATAPTGSLSMAWNTGGPVGMTVNAVRMTGNMSDGFCDATDATGAPPGLLKEIVVGPSGIIQGIYSNGKTAPMSATNHTIGMVSFSNPAGLLSLGGNRWDVSNNSGDPVAVQDNGLITITAGALEGSNVDMSTEFTRLIISQRGFQSNSKAFQTADAILQEANSLIR